MSKARSALFSVFGYFGSKDKGLKREAKDEARGLLIQLKEQAANVRMQAEAAAKLFPELKVVTGGQGRLEGTGAKADKLASDAKTAAGEARSLSGQIAKLAKDFPQSKELAKMADEAGVLATAAEDQSGGPSRLADAFRGAVTIGAKWGEMTMRVEGGLGFRVQGLGMSKDKSVVDPLQEELGAIRLLLEDASAANQGKAFNASRLTSVLGEAEKRAADLEKEVAALESGGTGPNRGMLSGACITQYDLQVRAANLPDAVNDALAKLQKVDRKIVWRHLSSVLAPFDAARDLFLAELGKADTPADMDKVLQTHLKRYDAMVKEFRAKVADTAKFAELSGVARTALADEAAESQFADQLEIADGKLAALYNLGSPRHGELSDAYWAKQLDVKADNAPDRFAKGVTAIKAFIGELDRAIADQKKAAEGTLAQAKGRREQLASIMANAKKTAPAETLTALDRQLALIDGLMAGGNAEAAEAILELTTKAYEVLNDALKEDGNAQTFEKLAKQYGDAFAKLPTDLLGSAWQGDLKARQAEFQKELSDLTEDPDRMDMAGELAKLRKLGDRWQRMLVQFRKLKEWQLATTERITALEGDLKTLDSRLPKGQPYSGHIRPDLADIKAKYQTPKADRGGIDAALGEMEKQMATYLDGTGIEAVKQDEAAQKKKGEDAKAFAEQQRKDRDDWMKFKVGGFNVQYENAEKVVKAAKGDMQALKKVKELFEKAKGYAQEFDFETANTELEMALGQLKDLSEFPQGVGQKSRAKLVALANEWFTLADSFAERIRVIGKAAADRGKEAKISEKQIVEIQTRVDALADRMARECAGAGQVFKTSFEKLATAKASDERLKLREDALRAVRAIRKTLRGEPLLGMIRNNPFKAVEVQWMLEKCLTNIELNATLAV